MSYNKGEVKFGNNTIEDGNVFYLPHSCDEWVIGNEEEAEQLIADLQELIRGNKK